MIPEFKISISKDFDNYTVTYTNIDVSLEQIYQSIKGILVALTYPEEMIDNYIIELAEELKQNKGEKDGLVI